MLFFIPTFVLRVENEGVCCGSDLVAQGGSAQRIEFRNTPTPSRVLQTMGTFCKKSEIKAAMSGLALSMGHLIC